MSALDRLEDRIPEIIRRVTIESILAERGHHPLRTSGGTALFRCVFDDHVDNHPSFDVKGERWNCRSQCNVGGDVIDLIMRLDNCTKAEAIEKLRASRAQLARSEPTSLRGPKRGGAARAVASIKPKVVATCIYDDENGDVLYREERIEPGRDGRSKDFRLSRPDGNGGWLYNLNGVRHVPFGVRELTQAKANGETIYIGEGVKCVEAIRALGFTATTFVNAKWNDECSEFFDDADVVLVPDNDEPGIAYAMAIYIGLAGVARSVRFLMLPDLLPKGDVANWVAGGGTKAEFEQLSAEAPDWESLPSADAADQSPQHAPVDLDALGIVPVEWDQVWKLDTRDADDWCIEPILPRGRQAAIFALFGTGKSLITVDVVAAKATGRSVLGHAPQPPVSMVYIDQEMTMADLQDRLGDLGYGPEDDLSNLHYYQLQDLPPLDTSEGGDVLMAIVERHQPEAVILDTMTALVAGDENLSNTYRDFYRCTGRRLKVSGVALLRLDHAGKEASRGQRGSSAKGDDLDLVWRLTVSGDTVTLSHSPSVGGKSRVSYVPETVAFTRETDPQLRHVLAPVGWPPGTLETANHLDALNVDLGASAALAIRTLKAAGQGRRKVVVLAALKLRRDRARTVPGTNIAKSVTETRELHAEPTSSNDTKPQVASHASGSRNQREPPEPRPPANGSQFPPSKEGTRDQARPSGGTTVDLSAEPAQ